MFSMKMQNKREQKMIIKNDLMSFVAMNTSEEFKTEPQTPCWGSSNDNDLTVSEYSQYNEQAKETEIFDDAMSFAGAADKPAVMTQNELLEQAMYYEENKIDMRVLNKKRADRAEEDKDNFVRLRKTVGKNTRAEKKFKAMFEDAKQAFDLNDEQVGQCMSKVNQFLAKKAEGEDLSGSFEGYAAVIIELASKEFELPIDYDDLLDLFGLTDKMIKNFRKKLQKVFGDWFRPTVSPKERCQQLVVSMCEKLKWTGSLETEAKYLAKKVHKEIESCQSLT